MKTFIVIPAYNEAKKVGKVLTSLQKAGYKNIVLVDDGSSDSTKRTALNKNVHVLSHIINRGQGAALKTGIDYALLKGADIIVTYDADGQFLVKDIKTVIAPVKKGEVDVVLGSRFLGQVKNIPKLKRLVLKLGVYVVYILYGIKVTDSQGGFRALSKKAAQKIEISADRMEHAAEFFAQIMKHKLKYKEVPITVIYHRYALLKGQPWTNSLDIGLRMVFRKLIR